MKNYNLLFLLGIILFLGWGITFLDKNKKVERPKNVVETPKKAEITNPQYVILSFDGSRSIPMWEETRKFAKENNINFTYFISGVYFIPNKDRFNYNAPGLGNGVSAIGFGGTEEEIFKRVEEVKAAQAEGNEIASHLNGHFRGGVWSKAQWQSELEQFEKFSPIKNVSGLRTPLLSRNNLLYEVLPNLGYKYDTSELGKMGEWPVKNKYGTWEIPLVTIPIAGTRGSTISMDYNFFASQTQAQDVLKRGTSQWNKYYQQMVDSYMNYFNNNYLGNRAPVIIGHHFSTWNDGVYWEAMKTVGKNVCAKPDVKCTTFSELVKYLDSK